MNIYIYTHPLCVPINVKWFFKYIIIIDSSTVITFDIVKKNITCVTNRFSYDSGNGFIDVGSGGGQTQMQRFVLKLTRAT